jgi:exodeoxyribonuclease V beta subunit
VGRLAERLPQQGLTAVVGQLLGSGSLARLALRGRALADLQQAAELVQEQMHRQGLSTAATADWLRNLRLQEERELPDEHRCRSDAAESAIAVVTIHRSKGLEYPVVICPYLWKAPPAPRSGSAGVGRRWRPPGSDRPRFDLHLSPHWGPGRAAAEHNLDADRQEAERRAYVACTRARHLLILGWPGAEAAEAGNPLSSWLLEGGDGALRTLPLHPLAAEALRPASGRWRPGPPSGALQAGPTPQRPLDSHWGRASYSAWAHAGSPLPPEAGENGRDSDALSRDGEDHNPASEATAGSATERTTTPPPAEPWPALGPMAQFPRGAGPGDALHRILEQIPYPALATGEPEAFRLLVERELERAGLELALADTLLEALQQLVRSPFGGALGAFRLADLPAGGWLNELNFDLPLAVQGKRLVRSSGLAAAFRNHPGGRFSGAYADSLEELHVASRGFLTGSIDLVFRWQERWWVADWKSNWLGQRDASGRVERCGPADYTPEAMAALMASNHYPLQAHLYLVALHRYLRWRLPGYDPQQHLGGYAYVFLRGVPGHLDATPSQVPGLVVEQPPLARLLALDALLREGQPWAA